MEVRGLLTGVRTDPTYKEWKQTVGPGELVLTAGTDPTYKEWKRVDVWQQKKGLWRTDPTYKEWKPCEVVPHNDKSPIRTDPTYKEWKLVYDFFYKKYFVLARILPTRNGNWGFFQSRCQAK